MSLPPGERWHKDNTILVSVRIPYATDIPVLLAAYLRDHPDVTRNGYIIKAIQAQLAHDGYSSEPESEKDT